MTEFQKGEVLWRPSMVAEYLGLTPKTIYRHIKNGTMFKPERIIRIGAQIRIPREEVFRIAQGIKREITIDSQRYADTR